MIGFGNSIRPGYMGVDGIALRDPLAVSSSFMLRDAHEGGRYHRGPFVSYTFGLVCSGVNPASIPYDITRFPTCLSLRQSLVERVSRFTFASSSNSFDWWRPALKSRPTKELRVPGTFVEQIGAA